MAADLDAIRARRDAVLAYYVENGPTADYVDTLATSWEDLRPLLAEVEELRAQAARIEPLRAEVAHLDRENRRLGALLATAKNHVRLLTDCLTGVPSHG